MSINGCWTSMITMSNENNGSDFIPRGHRYTGASSSTLGKHSVLQLSYLFANLHLLSSDFLPLWSFPSLIFSLNSDCLHSWACSWLSFSICPYCREFSFQTSFQEVVSNQGKVSRFWKIQFFMIYDRTWVCYKLCSWSYGWLLEAFFLLDCPVDLTFGWAVASTRGHMRCHWVTKLFHLWSMATF